MLASWRRLGYVKLSGLLALSLVVSFAFGVVLVRAGLGTDPDAQTPQAPPELALLEHKLPAAGSAGVPAEPIPPGAPAVEENRPVLGDSAWVLVDWGATNGPEGFEGVLPEWFVSSYRVGGEFVESAGWFTPATWPADQPAFLALSVARELWPHDLILDVCFFDAPDAALYAGLSGPNMEFAPVSDNLMTGSGEVRWARVRTPWSTTPAADTLCLSYGNGNVLVYWCVLWADADKDGIPDGFPGQAGQPPAGSPAANRLVRPLSIAEDAAAPSPMPVPDPVSTAASPDARPALDKDSPTAPPVTNLLVWLRSDVGVEISTNGRVTAWRDGSGLSNDFLGTALANMPVFSTEAMNGRGAVRFDGTNDFLKSAFVPSGEMTVLISRRYVAFRTNTTWSGLLCSRKTTAPCGGFMLAAYGSPAPQDRLMLQTGCGSNWCSGINFYNSYRLDLLPRTEIVRIGSTNTEIWVDGALIAQAPKGAIAPGTNLLLGAGSAGSYGANAEVSELLIYGQALSDADLAQARDYLGSRYNHAPNVNAGGLMEITLNAEASLPGVVSDDGYPLGGVVSSLWEQISGPASVELADPTLPATHAVFPAAGEYVLRLSAWDSELSASDDLTVTVNAEVSSNLPLNGLVVWLRSDAGVQTDESGKVLAWLDQSGQHNDFSFGGTLAANAPVFSTDAMNGRSAVRFDGTNDFLKSPYIPSGELTVLISRRYAAFRTNTTWSGLLSSQKTTAPCGGLLLAAYGSPAPQDRLMLRTGRGSNWCDGINFYNSFRLDLLPRTDVIRIGSTNTELWVDGVLVAQAAKGAIAPGTNLLLGAGSAGSYGFGGDVAELLIYGQALCDADLAQAENYLGSRYNHAPNVNAGGLMEITLNAEASLPGMVSDDGYPLGGAVSSIWEQISGPAAVELADPTLPATHAVFPAAGEYILRLSAWDNERSASDDLTVTVNTEVSSNLPLDGLVVWLRSDAGVQTNEAGKVLAWLDQSGNANNFSFWGTLAVNAPIFSADAMNGRGAVRFDGTNDYLKSNFKPAGELTVLISRRFMAFRTNSTWSGLLSSQKTTAPCGGLLLAAYGSPAPQDRLMLRTGRGSNWCDGINFYNLAKLDLLPRTDVIRIGATNTELWVDGVLVTQSPKGAIAPGTNLLLGAGSTGSYGANAEVSELLIYGQALSDADLAQARDYLGSRYNHAPNVIAGGLMEITLNAEASLPGTVSDDGYPLGGAVSSLWEQISGPAQVVLADPTLPATHAVFPAAGEYVLRLSAWDSELSASDDLTITVNTEVSSNLPLDGLVVWLRADAGVQTNDAGKVLAWLDQSGQHNNFSYGGTLTVNAPVFSADAMNGRGAVRFDGTNDYLKSNFNPDGELTVLIARRFAAFRTNSTWSGLLCSRKTTVPCGGLLLAAYGSPAPQNRLLLQTGRGSNWCSGVNFYNKIALDLLPRIDTIRISATNTALWLDGVCLTQFLKGAIAPGTNLLLGAGSTGSYGMNGDVSELLIYNRALGDAELGLAQAYIADRIRDLTPPVIAITAPTAENTWPTTNVLLTLSGEASDNVGIASIAWANDRGGTGACAGTTAWTAENLRLALGTNVITITVSDSAGNSTCDALTVIFTDTTPPVLAITQPTAEPWLATNAASLDLAGWASDDAGLAALSWTVTRVWPATNGEALVAQGDCTGLTNWSASAIPLSFGTNRIFIVASDSSGNTATAVLEVAVSGPPLAGLRIWVKADAGIGLDDFGGVVAWSNQVVVGDAFRQHIFGSRPVVISDALNGHSALTFDGVGDRLTNDYIPSGELTLLLVRQYGESNAAATQALVDAHAENPSGGFRYGAVPIEAGQEGFTTERVFTAEKDAKAEKEVSRQDAKTQRQEKFSTEHTETTENAGNRIKGSPGGNVFSAFLQPKAYSLQSILLQTGLGQSQWPDGVNAAGPAIPSGAWSLDTLVLGPTSACLRLDRDPVLSEPAAPMAPGAALALGASPSGADPFHGQVAELLLYERALTGAELDIVESYLGSRFNRQPVVDAGPDAEIRVTNTLALAATVSDDGFPLDGVLTSAWSLVSGPASPVFSDPALPAVLVSFPTTGVYVLRLTASDGALTAFDDLNVTVRPVIEITLSVPDYVVKGQPAEVAITVTPAMPEATMVLDLTTLSGLGAASFNDASTSLSVPAESVTIAIHGLRSSTESDNIRLSAVVDGVTYATNTFTVVPETVEIEPFDYVLEGASTNVVIMVNPLLGATNLDLAIVLLDGYGDAYLEGEEGGQQATMNNAKDANAKKDFTTESTEDTEKTGNRTEAGKGVSVATAGGISRSRLPAGIRNERMQFAPDAGAPAEALYSRMREAGKPADGAKGAVRFERNASRFSLSPRNHSLPTGPTTVTIHGATRSSSQDNMRLIASLDGVEQAQEDFSVIWVLVQFAPLDYLFTGAATNLGVTVTPDPPVENVILRLAASLEWPYATFENGTLEKAIPGSGLVTLLGCLPNASLDEGLLYADLDADPGPSDLDTIEQFTVLDFHAETPSLIRVGQTVSLTATLEPWFLAHEAVLRLVRTSGESGAAAFVTETGITNVIPLTGSPEFLSLVGLEASSEPGNLRLQVEIAGLVQPGPALTVFDVALQPATNIHVLYQSETPVHLVLTPEFLPEPIQLDLISEGAGAALFSGYESPSITLSETTDLILRGENVSSSPLDILFQVTAAGLPSALGRAQVSQIALAPEPFGLVGLNATKTIQFSCQPEAPYTLRLERDDPAADGLALFETPAGLTNQLVASTASDLFIRGLQASHQAHNLALVISLGNQTLHHQPFTVVGIAFEPLTVLAEGLIWPMSVMLTPADLGGDELVLRLQDPQDSGMVTFHNGSRELAIPASMPVDLMGFLPSLSADDMALVAFVDEMPVAEERFSVGNVLFRDLIGNTLPSPLLVPKGDNLTLCVISQPPDLPFSMDLALMAGASGHAVFEASATNRLDLPPGPEHLVSIRGLTASSEPDNLYISGNLAGVSCAFQPFTVMSAELFFPSFMLAGDTVPGVLTIDPPGLTADLRLRNAWSEAGAPLAEFPGMGQFYPGCQEGEFWIYGLNTDTNVLTLAAELFLGSLSTNAGPGGGQDYTAALAAQPVQIVSGQFTPVTCLPDGGATVLAVTVSPVPAATNFVLSVARISGNAGSAAFNPEGTVFSLPIFGPTNVTLYALELSDAPENLRLSLSIGDLECDADTFSVRRFGGLSAPELALTNGVLWLGDSRALWVSAEPELGPYEQFVCTLRTVAGTGRAAFGNGQDTFVLTSSGPVDLLAVEPSSQGDNIELAITLENIQYEGFQASGQTRGKEENGSTAKNAKTAKERQEKTRTTTNQANPRNFNELDHAPADGPGASVATAGRISESRPLAGIRNERRQFAPDAGAPAEAPYSRMREAGKPADGAKGPVRFERNASRSSQPSQPYTRPALQRQGVSEPIPLLVTNLAIGAITITAPEQLADVPQAADVTFEIKPPDKLLPCLVGLHNAEFDDGDTYRLLTQAVETHTLTFPLPVTFTEWCDHDTTASIAVENFVGLPTAGTLVFYPDDRVGCGCYSRYMTAITNVVAMGETAALVVWFDCAIINNNCPDNPPWESICEPELFLESGEIDFTYDGGEVLPVLVEYENKFSEWSPPWWGVLTAGNVPGPYTLFTQLQLTNGLDTSHWRERSIMITDQVWIVSVNDISENNWLTASGESMLLNARPSPTNAPWPAGWPVWEEAGWGGWSEFDNSHAAAWSRLEPSACLNDITLRARCGSADPGQFSQGTVVGVDFIRCLDPDLTSYLEEPGSAETLTVPVSTNPLVFTTAPLPAAAPWPAGWPQWDGTETNAMGQAILDISQPSASDTGTLVQVRCGLSAKAIRVIVVEMAIEQAETNVCWNTASTVLNLIEDGWWPSHTDEIVWSSEPVGLSNVVVSADFKTFSFVPSNSLPGEYTIKARSILASNCFDTCTVRVCRAILRVDTDRDGDIDEDDETGKNSFTNERGAFILANTDRDSGSTTYRDCENDHVDGGADRAELAKLRGIRLNFPSIPANLRMLLRMDQSMTNYVRIFRGDLDNSPAMLGPGAGELIDGKICTNIPASWLTGSGDFPMMAEALKYIGENSGFDGKIHLELAIQELRAGAWSDMDTDEIMFQVAPVVLAWNGQEAEKVYATDCIASMIDVLTTVPVTNVPVEYIGLGNYLLTWPQDAVEIGNCYGGSNRMPVMIDLCYSNSSWVTNLCRDTEHYYGYSHPNLLQVGEGGDMDVTWPFEGWPLGRYIEGDKADSEFRTFIISQNIQAQNKYMGFLYVVTDWLTVGHIDEILSFIPSNHAVLVASPKMAVDKLHELLVAEHGDAAMRVSDYDESYTTKTVKEVLVKPIAGKYLIARLTEDIEPATTTFSLDTNVFTRLPAFPDFLRIGVEYVQILTATNNLITVTRGEWATNDAGSEPSMHNAGAIIYCLNDVVRENLYKPSPEREGPFLHLQRQRSILSAGLAPVVPTFVELPVLFFRPYPNDPDQSRKYKFTALSGNVINGLVLGGSLITIDPMGPQVAGVDQFRQLIDSQLSGLIAPVYINAWELQRYHGGVHCGSNARREPVQGAQWWDAWHGQ